MYIYIYIPSIFSFLFGSKSLRYFSYARTNNNRLWLIEKPFFPTFSRCAHAEFERGKNRMNMDSNMKLSHLSFRNHCIFRSLNNFSSEGQFLRPINGGAIFLFFFSSPPPSRLFHNYFFRSPILGKLRLPNRYNLLPKFLIEIKKFFGKNKFLFEIFVREGKKGGGKAVFSF